MLVNFGWIRDGALAGMGMPGPDAWAELAGLGIRAVLSLTASPPPGDPAAAGLRQAHVPLVDFGTPTQEALTACVRWIDARLAQEHPVVVHCMAGQGRTGTVLAAWLVGTGLPPEEAIAEVRRVRPHSIETRGQELAVYAFAEVRLG